MDVRGCFTILARELTEETCTLLAGFDLMARQWVGLGWKDDLLEQLMTLSSNGGSGGTSVSSSRKKWSSPPRPYPWMR